MTVAGRRRLPGRFRPVPGTSARLLLELAVSDLFRAKWSHAVHEEWISALLRRRPDLSIERLTHTRRLMDAHVRDALVTGFEDLVDTIQLPDPNDRHVVAAAVWAEADVVVTANLRDFPESALSPRGLVAQHPDAFLADLCIRSPTLFLKALHRVRARLRNPPFSGEQHLDALRRVGLHTTVEEVLKRAASFSPRRPRPD